jgi:hypothetical protein
MIAAHRCRRHDALPKPGCAPGTFLGLLLLICSSHAQERVVGRSRACFSRLVAYAGSLTHILVILSGFPSPVSLFQHDRAVGDMGTIASFFTLVCLFGVWDYCHGHQELRNTPPCILVALIHWPIYRPHLNAFTYLFHLKLGYRASWPRLNATLMTVDHGGAASWKVKHTISSVLAVSACCAP